MLKAILFDMDDTLIDWGDFSGNWERLEIPHIEAVYQHLCTLGEIQGGLEVFSKEYFTRTRTAWFKAHNSLIAPHVGRVLTETAIHLGIPQDNLDMRACLDAYGWGRIAGVSLFPEVIDSLKLLRDKGLRFGIITNAYQPMWMRDVELEHYGLMEFFPECRFSAADFGYLKPHPDIFTHALDCLGITAEEAVFIGDNPTADIAGAQAVGMKGVLRVIKRMAPLISGLIVPDAAINTLEELPAVLSEWYPGWDQ
jgi:FMN phosphatase YigB (HAD superfamily)